MKCPVREPVNAIYALLQAMLDRVKSGLGGSTNRRRHPESCCYMFLECSTVTPRKSSRQKFIKLLSRDTVAAGDVTTSPRGIIKSRKNYRSREGKLNAALGHYSTSAFQKYLQNIQH